MVERIGVILTASVVEGRRAAGSQPGLTIAVGAKGLWFVVEIDALIPNYQHDFCM
jgi:hypothetical protein